MTIIFRGDLLLMYEFEVVFICVISDPGAPGPMQWHNCIELELRRQQKQSAMPDGVVANLIPEHLADLIAYLQSRI